MSESVSPRVTVVVPVYNSASTLRRCLQSARRQTISDIEIIVADDGSTDESGAIAEEIAVADPRIRVIRISPNGGKPAAMNRMIAEANGEWVAVLDADDAYADDRLQLLIEAAERHGTEMAADNLVYVDGGADQVVRTAFGADSAERVITKRDLLRNSDSYAGFDFGILKPVMRRQFLIDQGLSYFEATRLAEDFYYLMNFFLAEGRGVLVAKPLYFWTMPFGAVSRRWTETGSGAWRYDYRQALAANGYFIEVLRERGEMAGVAMLEARAKQYRVMIHYLDAQRSASQGRWAQSLRSIVSHPSTYPLLARRIWGRFARTFRPDAPTPNMNLQHPSLRSSS